MNIHIVRDNLKNTIAGKEKMLESVREGGTTTVSHTIIHMLNINIDELKKILADVEKCIPAEYEFDDDDSDEVRNLIKMGR